MKIIRIFALFFCYLGLSLTANASSFQMFSGLNFSNPAELVTVEHQEIIAGGTWLWPHTHFDGEVGVDPDLVHDAASNLRLIILPQGRYAIRLNKKLIVGVDVTEPFATDVRYSTTDPIAVLGSQTTIHSIRVSPSAVWQVNDKLAIAGGPDFEHLSAVINLVIPMVGELKNEGSDWATSWHAGILYRAAKGTFLGASYYALIDHHVKGKSSLAGITVDTLNTNAELPGIATFTATQFFSEKFFVRLWLSYVRWNQLQSLTLKDTATGGDLPPILLEYRNTMYYSVGTRYWVTDKCAIDTGVSYDESPTNMKDESVRAPDGNIFGVGIGVHVVPVKAVAIDIDYGHGFIGTVNINNITSGFTNKGTAKLRDDSLTVMLTLKLG